LLEGEDVLRTAAALRAMGVDVIREDGAAGGVWRVRGRGVGGLVEPAQTLDLGNAGTAARLLMGVVATHNFTSFFTGDASLTSRPMARVTTPLSLMGAGFVTRSGGRLPLAVIGAGAPVPIDYVLPVASAQVKSAVLLAGLNAPGRTGVVEAAPTRDHTERMLRHFGAEVTERAVEGGTHVAVAGHVELTAADIVVPADISSAAFPLVAAAALDGSDVLLPGIGVNPRRTGIIDCLIEMGASVERLNERVEGGEPVADLRVRGGRLTAIDVPADRAPSMIDEYPVLAMAAAMATGATRMRGLAELRVKESDRLTSVAQGLADCGVAVEIVGDDLIVHGTGGTGGQPRGGAVIQARLDHRIAMAFLVLGAFTQDPVTVDDGSPIDTSFPNFIALMNGLGCRIA
jgi:3-phosphoshikimate 1-carboxyvinyltransferase